MGHLIPAGTGFHTHRKVELIRDEPEAKKEENILKAS